MIEVIRVDWGSFIALGGHWISEGVVSCGWGFRSVIDVEDCTISPSSTVVPGCGDVIPALYGERHTGFVC